MRGRGSFCALGAVALGAAVAGMVVVGTVAVGTVPSAASGTCARSVAADPTPDAAAAGRLQEALDDAVGVTAATCPDGWTVDLSGHFAVTTALNYTATLPLRLRGPSGGTAVLEARPATPGGVVAHRILTIDTDEAVPVTLERLLLTGGNVSEAADAGGAVYADDLRLLDVELRSNRAAEGGAVFTTDLRARRTSFVGNEAEFGVAEGGAVLALGDVVLDNVTFDGNAAGAGGALWVDVSLGSDGGALVATFVTFLGNDARVAGSGADLHLDSGLGPATPASVTLRGVVFAGTAPPAVTACGGGYDFDGATVTASFEVDSGPTASCGAQLLGAAVFDPAVDRVAFRTGMTALHLPPAASPLVDAVPCGVGWPDEDQRGVERPQGTLNRCDAGAVEREVSRTRTRVDTRTESESEEPEAPPVMPVPTSIPAGDGACADGCAALSDAAVRAPRR